MSETRSRLSVAEARAKTRRMRPEEHDDLTRGCYPRHHKAPVAISHRWDEALVNLLKLRDDLAARMCEPCTCCSHDPEETPCGAALSHRRLGEIIEDLSYPQTSETMDAAAAVEMGL